MERLMRREERWWPALCALMAAAAALALALGVPRLFSDPNGLDPHILRLSAVSAALVIASTVSPRLAPTRPVLLAVATVCVSFSVLSVTPPLLRDAFGERLSGDARLLWASAAQAAATLAAVPSLRRWVPPGLGPELRLRRFGLRAAALALAGILLLVPMGLAIPAALLGREGIPVQAVARDLPWLGPACLLQAFAQELQFRGLLLGSLERVAPAGTANLAQAALFGLAHLAIQYPGPVGPFIPVTFAAGLVLGWIVRVTGSLWPAVLIHGAADIAITATVLPGLYGS